MVSQGEVFLVGAHITPLISASTHVITTPTRQRKLLMNRAEIDRLVGAVERSGYTLVPLELYWKGSRAKLRSASPKGKKQHDKRATEKGSRLGARQGAGAARWPLTRHLQLWSARSPTPCPRQGASRKL